MLGHTCLLKSLSYGLVASPDPFSTIAVIGLFVISHTNFEIGSSGFNVNLKFQGDNLFKMFN